MKKLIFGLVLASVLVACNDGGKTEEVKSDSTSVTVDSTKVDSTVVTVDSTVAAPAQSVGEVK